MRQLWIQENKTKSRIDLRQLTKRMSCDLQTMFYLVAAQQAQQLGRYGFNSEDAINNVLYNVIKRPAQYQGKKETRGGFQERLAGIIRESPGDFFERLTITLSTADVERFKRRTLHPLLENLCDDYEWWVTCLTRGRNLKIAGVETRSWDMFDYQLRQDQFPHHKRRHWQMPHGVWNPTLEGASVDVDEYIEMGTTVGLVRAETLFRELEQ